MILKNAQIGNLYNSMKYYFFADNYFSRHKIKPGKCKSYK